MASEAKRARTEEASDSGQGEINLKDLSGFTLERVLNENSERKSIFLEGKIKVRKN